MIARLYKRNISGRVTLLPGTELMRVTFNKSQQNEEAFFSRNIHSRTHVSPMLLRFSIPETLFPVSGFCFKMQIILLSYATRQGILTKIRACEQLQKFCEHKQASTHLIFASNSRKGKILRSLSNWMGPFYTPS